MYVLFYVFVNHFKESKPCVIIVIGHLKYNVSRGSLHVSLVIGGMKGIDEDFKIDPTVLKLKLMYGNVFYFTDVDKDTFRYFPSTHELRPSAAV